MIHLDTNFLILALVPGSSQDLRLRNWMRDAEPIQISTVAWTEFLCGPIGADQKQFAAALFRSPEPLLPSDAFRAAELFNQSGRRRGSLIDCMIAAVCINRAAELATENRDDFRRFEPMGLRMTAP